MQSQKESKENSLCVMKELNSVLAVRNVEKKRKRELREWKKRNHPLTPNEDSVGEPVQSEHEVPHLPSIQQVGVAMATSEPDMTTAVEKKLELDKETPTRDSELPFLLLSERELQCSSSSAIAHAVAAVALRKGRADNEEVFNDQDSCSTASEPEDEPRSE